MLETLPLIAAIDFQNPWVLGPTIVVALVVLLCVVILIHYGSLWLQAYMSNADVSVASLVGMGFRQVKPSLIVTAKVMGRQAGLNIDRLQGMSTATFRGPLPGWRGCHAGPSRHYRG